jgi:hypothetical protein
MSLYRNPPIKKQLIKLSDYLNSRFVKGSAPDKRTLILMIENGEIAGKKLGKIYFVEVTQDNIEIGELGV